MLYSEMSCTILVEQGSPCFQSGFSALRPDRYTYPEHIVQSQNQILKLLLSWGLGYMRWTQLTPMLLLWGFGLLMLLALTIVNFQELTISALEFILEWLMRLPVVGDQIATLLSDKKNEIHIATGNFKTFVLSSWAALSLMFMLASIILSLLFGPFQPWTLKRKLQITSGGAVLLLAGMTANYYAAPEYFNGQASAWILNFSLISLLVFVVSAYCLSIAHFLSYLNDALMADELNTSNDPRDIQ